MNFSIFISALILPSGYTQMAHTVESVLGRQMKKHFPDDHRHPSKAVDIHRSYQDHTMPDHPIADPAMFTRHSGKMRMSNRMMPGAMPYPGQLQSLYRPQMYPGDPVFAQFNMNESTRGGGATVFPAMMGMPHPSMTMNTRAPAQFPAQEMQTADAAARGIAPIATKGKAISIFYQVFFTPIFINIISSKLDVIAAILKIFTKLGTMRSTNANLDDDVGQKKISHTKQRE